MSGFSVFHQVVVTPDWRRIGGVPGVALRRAQHGEQPVSRRRLALGLRVEDLAELAGLSSWTIWRLESGRGVKRKSRERVLQALRQVEKAAA